MRVVIAPDRFAGTLTAREAAEAIAAGWRRHAPGDDLDLCPLSDGGTGFVDVVAASVEGRSAPVAVTGPTGRAALGVVHLTLATSGGVVAGSGVMAGSGAGPTAGDGSPVAYVESAAACGTDLIDPGDRDPARASSSGLGTLLAAAVRAGAGKIVVGVGGVVTNDAGAGMLAGLATALDLPGAADLTARLGHGGVALRGITAAGLTGLRALTERLAGVEIVAATDSDVVLLGFKGVSALHAQAKGATPEVAQELDLALADFARAAVDALGLPQKLVAEAGSGAGGGLGFGLRLLGATRRSGAALVAETVGLSERLSGADLVVTGEGTLDWQSLRGRVVTAVAHAAQQVAVPTVAVAGQVLVGRRELLGIGVDSAYPIARTPAEVEASIADPAARLADRAQRVARTWSRA